MVQRSNQSKIILMFLVLICACKNSEVRSPNDERLEQRYANERCDYNKVKSLARDNFAKGEIGFVPVPSDISIIHFPLDETIIKPESEKVLLFGLMDDYPVADIDSLPNDCTNLDKSQSDIFYKTAEVYNTEMIRLHLKNAEVTN